MHLTSDERPLPWWASSTDPPRLARSVSDGRSSGWVEKWLQRFAAALRAYEVLFALGGADRRAQGRLCLRRPAGKPQHLRLTHQRMPAKVERVGGLGQRDGLECKLERFGRLALSRDALGPHAAP